MSEILFCTVVIAMSLVAIVAIVGMTIYHIAKSRAMAERRSSENQ